MNVESNSNSEEMKKTTTQEIMDLSLDIYFYPGHLSEYPRVLQIFYVPIIQETASTFSNVTGLANNFQLRPEKLPLKIQEKLDILERILIPFIPLSYEIKVGRDTLKFELVIQQVQWQYYTHTGTPTGLSFTYTFPNKPGHNANVDLIWESLSRSQQLVVSNISSWAKNEAWASLANEIRKLSGQPAQEIRGHKVFLSYKKRSKAEPVAETVAHRLSQQYIDVWFDKWEIHAGDSVAGKIGEGFKDIDACLIFLESQYSSSGWCTTEMNTALTKAIEEDLVVIPILVEDCDKPELLKELKPIYLKEPSADEFEQGLTEITDAIYRVDLNPYR